MGSKNKFKVILMGGNLIGCKILRHLFRMKNVSIPLVVSNWQDNGSVIEPNEWNSSLTRVALAKGIRVIQPLSIHSPEFLRDIYNLERPDLVITADYDHYLDPVLLALPRLGVVNIHFSKLPRHRGDMPYIWSVFEDDETGVTIHWVNEQVNAGDIIAQETIKIDYDDTSFTVYNRLTQIGIKLFAKIFPKIIDGTADRIPQNEDDASYHASGYPNQCIIDWTEPAEKIRRLIYSLDFPTATPATTFFDKVPVSIFPPVTVLDKNSNKFPDPGTISGGSEKEHNHFVVQTGDGQLVVEKFSLGTGRKSIFSGNVLFKMFGIYHGARFTIFDQLKIDKKLNLIYTNLWNFAILQEKEPNRETTTSGIL